ncbi:unnamed protein product [Leptosia nina]|uniref:Acyltransferase 3 domain-containing protein n=1 Tax=Leptosia nina TaxID=320188 RepID=A0AAV1JPV1_9NEOP
MNKIGVFLTVVVAITNCSGVIYSLNDAELELFPPVYRWEDSEKCMKEPNGVYCVVDANLVTDTPNPLLNTIHEYSQHTALHYNRTYITYGICLTSSCKSFNNLDRKQNIEGCLNETLWREYKLKTKLHEEPACIQQGKQFEITTTDLAVAALFAWIVFLSFIGTSYDLYFKDRLDFQFLAIFSVRRHWDKLVDTSEKTNSIQNRLKCLDGIRAIFLILLFGCHACFLVIINVSNPSAVEESFAVEWLQPLMNMHLSMSCFFLISSTLLSYNLQISKEKKDITKVEILRRMLKRWCRLTPTYAIVLLYIVTWYRHQGSGPFWMSIYKSRIEPCREIGWYNILYVNNFLSSSMCMLQTWYLAAEMQLHLLGLIVCIIFNGTTRRIVLCALFMVGLIIPAILTYIHDLDMQLMTSIELVRKYFLPNPTFQHVYRHSYTNVSCYAMGLSLGLIVYHLQLQNFNIQKYKNYLPLYYFALLVNAGVIYLGSVPYANAPRLSITIRVVLAAIMKPVLAGGTAVLIFGAIFKYEDKLRSFLEWKGWTILYRLCYSAYLVHLSLIDYQFATSDLRRASYIEMAILAFGVIAVSFIVALMLWLLVESPLAEITDQAFKEKNISLKDNSIVSNGKKTT